MSIAREAHPHCYDAIKLLTYSTDPGIIYTVGDIGNPSTVYKDVVFSNRAL
jgi:hypothetical protein